MAVPPSTAHSGPDLPSGKTPIQDIAPYYAAAVQTAFDAPRHRDEIGSRVDHMLEIARQTIVGYEPFFDVRLLVYPEFSHAAPIHDTVDALARDLAVELPNEHVDAYAHFCAEYGCWIQTGTFLEIDPDIGPDVLFNTTLLVGPDGVELKYRKLNPWIPWEVHASPHDIDPTGDHLPVAHTDIGCIGVAVCYDWLFPEVLRELRHKGAEVLCRVSAYMDPWGATPPMDWWTLFNRARAAENTCFVVASNQGAHRAQYPPFSWPGGSMVVDFDGRILAQAEPGPGERVVVAPINISALRHERNRRQGHDMTTHHRGTAYPYAQQPGFAPAGEHPITIESLKDRITIARGGNT
jgi:predicted amidohydrolase